MWIFSSSEETLKYLKFSGRDEQTVALVEAYAKEQGLWASDDIVFTDTLSLDMSTVVPTISGPKDRKIKSCLQKLRLILIKFSKILLKEKSLYQRMLQERIII